MIFAAIKRFYSWHFSFPVGAARMAVVTPDNFAGFMAVVIVWTPGLWLLPAYMGFSPIFLMVASFVFLLVSPLLAWQIVLVTANRTSIVRSLFVVPYWITRIPPGTGVELYEAWEDPAPSSVAYKVRNDHAHLGNGWNARSLFDLLRECERRVRPNTSLEHPPGE